MTELPPRQADPRLRQMVRIANTDHLEFLEKLLDTVESYVKQRSKNG